MHIEGLAIIPRCVECKAHWLPADRTTPWQAWLTYDDPLSLPSTAPPAPSASSVRPTND